MTSLKKLWPWLLLVLVPLWLVGAVGELRDARLLEQEAVQVSGTIASARWSQRRAGRMLDIDVDWPHEGRLVHGSFSLPSQAGLAYADEDGRVTQPTIEVRYARSKPQVAALLIQPPDPAWVSAILAGVGFCVVSGVVGFLILEWRGGRGSNRPARL